MSDNTSILTNLRLLVSGEKGGPSGKYRSLFRPLGAFFDQQEASFVTVAEVDLGFIWQFFPRGNLVHPQYGLIPYEELPTFGASIKQARLQRARLARVAEARQPKRSWLGRRPEEPAPSRFSSGYEEVLRSLGNSFDADRMSNVLVTETKETWVIRTCLPVPTFVQAHPTRLREGYYFHEALYTHEDLGHLIATVRSLRGNGISGYAPER